MPCPYIGDYDGAMEVVWHDNHFIQCYIVKMQGDFHPYTLGDFSEFGQLHFTVNDGSKQTSMVVRAYRDEIGRWLCVIVSAQPNRTAMRVFKLWRIGLPNFFWRGDRPGAPYGFLLLLCNAFWEAQRKKIPPASIAPRAGSGGIRSTEPKRA